MKETYFARSVAWRVFPNEPVGVHSYAVCVSLGHRGAATSYMHVYLTGIQSKIMQYVSHTLSMYLHRCATRLENFSDRYGRLILR